MPRPSELSSSYIIHHLFLTGHFWSSSSEVSYKDLSKLSLSSPEVEAAARSFSRMDAHAYTEFVLEDHARLPHFDGIVGPSLRKLIAEPRCWVPDFEPPGEDSIPELADFDLEQIMMSQLPAEQATGEGNWRGCHGIGNYHCAVVSVDRSGIGKELSSVFKQVLTNVQQAFDQIGLRFIFVDQETSQDIVTGQTHDHAKDQSNISFTFVSRSSGWLGLAVVGKNQRCHSSIWCKYLSTYRPSNMVREWTTLLKHELGHNCGFSHTTGGVMNPSIVKGLPTEWSDNDPSYGKLVRKFGGEPIGDNKPPAPRPDSIEDRLARLERRSTDLLVRDAVQDATIDYLLQRTKSDRTRMNKDRGVSESPG